MAIEKMNEHYSFTNPASIYDEEAMTALELAGRQAKKINEVVDAQNNLDAKTNETLHRFEEATIPAEVEDTVNKYIEKGTFDEAIGEHLDGLNDRVNNLLGKVTEGSTTMDAEVIDARVNPRTSVAFTNLFSNLKNMYGDSLSLRQTPSHLDANLCCNNGFYWISTGLAWKNVPVYDNSGLSIGGYLLTFNDDGYEATSLKNAHAYQLFLGANGNLYFRNGKADGTFFEWGKILTEVKTNSFVENVLSPVKTELNNNTLKRKSMLVDYSNIDNISDNGFYFISSSQTYENLPEGENAGMLCCFLGLNNYSRYQLFFSFTGNMYMRNCNVDTTFKEWKRLATSTDIITSNDNGKEYTIQKKDDSTCYIFKKGVKGLIRYEYGKHTDESINLNVYRLCTIAYCNYDGSVINYISEFGSDLEGVIILEGDTDHIGGVHGDEQMTDSFMFVDGKQYTFDTIDSMAANEIQIIIKSNIHHQDGGSVCFNKIKRTVFDKDGVHTYLEWVPTENININSIRSCMMSVNKSVITHIFDSNVEKYPFAFPEGEGNDIINNPKLNDVFYVGEVSVKHYAGERGGSSENMNGFISNYGYRLKSYFTCYDNYSAKIGEKLTATNNFYITC